MCGIAGIVQNYNKINLIPEINNMSSALEHRGPDNTNFWRNEANVVALGHTRLSIIDLTKSGNQPMHSSNKRFVISFNGEIYNYRELKKKINNDYSHIKEIKWTNNTDTEVILNLLNIFTFQETLELLKGMFVIAIWDNKKNVLHIARDRAGEKPIYYYFKENFFIFASELKSIKKFSYFDDQINKDSVTDLIDRGYIAGTKSIYLKTKKIKPGFFLSLDQNKMKYSLKRYWKLNTKYNNNKNLNENNENSTNTIEKLLKSSLLNQLHADVPVGIFLSGGIDSSLIVSLTKDLGIKPKTFSIGFEDDNFDEAKDSKKIANYLDTEHFEHFLTGRQALDLIPKMQNIYCEPFGDSSQIPTYLISKIARQYVKVVLSGDGGDELFGGYNRYAFAYKYFLISKFIPNFFKNLSSNLLSGLKPSTIQKIYKSGEIFIPKKYRVSNFSDKSTKLSMVLSSKSIEDFYNRITSNIHIYGDIMLNNNKEDYYSSKLNHSDFGYMLENDFNTYLPDDILVKVDRASMANSLEVRAPFLDHEVIEFAFDMNFNEKINFSENKIPLRKLLKKYLPENMISKNKRGFGIPLNRWLKEDLREWAEELISVKNIKEHDFFDYEKVKEVWNSHLSGKKENQNIIWPLLMFQSWLLKEKI